MPADLKLSVVMPAYNEELNISEAMQEVQSGLPSCIKDYEFLIVDDGSNDKTADIVREIAAGDRRVKLIVHDINRGYGAALTTGFRSAGGTWILFLDADRQISIDELPAFLEAALKHDMVIGFRAGRCDSLARRVLSRGYALLAAVALGVRVRDINCPFKLFRKSLVNELDLNSQGFLINAEFLYKAGRKGHHFKEMPVLFRDRQKGKSTVRFRHALQTLRELVRLLGAK